MSSYGKYEPRVHNFRDSYHRPSKFGDEETAVRSVRRKYKTFKDYNNAIKIIRHYFEKVISHYGPHKFKKLYESGKFEDFIPPFPVLRRTDDNMIQLLFGYERPIIHPTEEDLKISKELYSKFINSAHGEEGLYFIRSDQESLRTIPGNITEEQLFGLQEKNSIDKEVARLMTIAQLRLESRKINRPKTEVRDPEVPIPLLELMKRYEDRENNRFRVVKYVKEKPEPVIYTYKGLRVTLKDRNSLEIERSFTDAGFTISIDRLIDDKTFLKALKSKEKREKVIKEESKKSQKVVNKDVTVAFRAWEKEMGIFNKSKEDLDDIPF